MKDLAQPGDVIGGRYVITRAIGRGSMADVYDARDRSTDQEVAIKIMRRRLTNDPESMERFRREAQVQEMIQHRNVARLYGGGATERGEPFLVVELLRGRTMRHVVRREGPASPSRAASYGCQALKGLEATHAVGVLHRDLKPANLMLEPSPGPVERVVLIDFGFAALEGGARLTQRGHVVGSLAYLPPERLLGEEGDERADLYALGVILYELLAGQRPFVADNDYELMNQHLEVEPVPLRRVAPDAAIPVQLEAVVMQALRKKPEQRYRSAREMADQLEEAAEAGAR